MRIPGLSLVRLSCTVSSPFSHKKRSRCSYQCLTSHFLASLPPVFSAVISVSKPVDPAAVGQAGCGTERQGVAGRPLAVLILLRWTPPACHGGAW